MLPACILFRGGVIGSPLMASADLVGFLREKSKAPARQRIVDHGRPGARTNTGVLLLLLAVAACTGEGLEPGSALSDVWEDVENPDVFEVEAESTVSAVEEQYDLFDQERLPTLKITLSEAAERQLIDEPRAKDYVPAQIELIDGDVDERVEVGLRLKGKGSFKPLDAKAAFRIKINKYRKNQTLRGLKDLTLNNMMQDRSLMAERLAYHVFREMNVAAPRVNHVLVYVNDVYYGVYANIETPNEDFLAHWLDEPGRNLYEQANRDFDHPEAVASFELETNKQQPDDRKGLHALHEACVAFDLPRARELVDWPRFMLYSALEAAVNQVDGYSYGQSGANNYRIYDSPTGWIFIPWGLDWALGRVATQDGGLFVDPLWVRPNHGVLMRMCLADEACKREYAEVVRSVAARWDALELEGHMDKWSAQIDEAFRADDRREVTIETALEHREIRRTVIRGRAQALIEAVEAY